MHENSFLVFTKKQTTYVSAGLIIVVVTSFTIGYIVGQKTVLYDFAEQIQENSFVDHVQCSLYAGSQEPARDLEHNVVETAEEHEDETEGTSQAQTEGDVVEQVPAGDKKFYAQLCGFGSLMTARRFVDRVHRLGIDVILVEKKGRNKKGRVLTWYQVVTPRYADKEKLLKDVEKVQLAEKLQNVTLIEE